MRVAIYTAIFGEYDAPQQPLLMPKGCDFFLFTDAPKIRSGKWQALAGKKYFTDPRRNARYYKTLSHRLFPKGYDFTIWVDGNYKIHADLTRFITGYLKDADLAICKHPQHRCAYQEGKECARQRLDRPEVIAAQLARYRAAGFPGSRGMVDTSCVVRRCTSKVAEFNEIWHAEIEKGSRRDQISVMYAMWKSGVSFAYMRHHAYINSFYARIPHKVRDKTKLT